MGKYDALAKAIVDAFVGKMVRIALSALLILWIMQLFQGTEFWSGPGFIGWSKNYPDTIQYKVEGVGDSVRLTTERKAAAWGIALGMPPMR